MLRILVVDDESISRKMVSSILEKNLFTTATAENGKECMRKCKSTPQNFTPS